MDNNTRRYPRTLQQAFGPYAGSNIEPMASNESKSWVIWAACFTCFVMGTLTCLYLYDTETSLAAFSMAVTGVFTLVLLAGIVMLIDIMSRIFLSAIDWIKDGDGFF